MNDSFKGMSLVPGKDFDVVTISFDPTDTFQLAAAKKQNYIELLGKPEAAAGWHWLVGEKPNIDRVAGAIGFHYQYNEKEKLYAHSAAIYVLSSGGKITRYLYGISFDKDMRLAVVEASEGKVGTTLDRLILFCCPYDLSTHQYTLVAMRVMRLGGIATLLVLGGILGPVWWRERRKRRPEGVPPGDRPTRPSAPQLPSPPASGSIPPTSRPTT
jgi:protein SCO1/2